MLCTTRVHFVARQFNLSRMVHCLQVFFLATVFFTSSVLSNNKPSDKPDVPPSAPEVEQIKPKINTLKGEVEVKLEYMDELNEMISRYLYTMEGIKRSLRDDDAVSVIETIILLITQSWINTLKPDPDLVTLEGTNLETLTNEIQNTLVVQKRQSRVVDDIITYTKDIELTLIKSFEEKRKHLENAENIFQKYIKKAAGAKNEIEADHLSSAWEGIFLTLNQINGNLVVHKFLAPKMYVQSYVNTFLPRKKRSEDKITLISTDKKSNKRFRIPPMEGMDIFSDILLGDPEEVDKLILSKRISHYLRFFEEKREATTSDELAKAMGVVRQLIVQGWMETLNPPSTFFPSEESYKTKKDIANELVLSNVHYSVNNAILLFIKEEETTIENELKAKQTDLFNEYKRIEDEVKNVPSSEQSKALNRIENQINELQDYLIAHKISKQFYLHSYKEDFVKDSTGKFVIKASKGEQSETFEISPINLMNFYEKPIFE